MSGESLIIGDLRYAVKTNKLLGYTLESTLFTAKDVDFARTTTGTYLNDSGTFSTAAVGIARKQVSSLLMEQSKTNLQPNYNVFNSAEFYGWSTTQANAPTLTENFISSDKTLILGNGYTYITANTNYCYSAIIKKTSGANRWVRIWVYSGGGVYIKSQYLNLQTGVLTGSTEVQPGHSWSNYQTGVVNLNNGYYQLYLTASEAYNNNLQYAVRLYFYDADQGLTTYTGTGASFTVYGSQVEAGSNPSSLIPTTASTVTRNADYCYKTLSLPSSYTINVETLLNASNLTYDTSSYVLYDSRVDTNNRITLYRFQNSFWVDVVVNGSSVFSAATFTIQNPIIGTIYKIALRVNPTSFDLFINGTLQLTQVVSSMPNLTSGNTVSVGCVNGTSNSVYNGTISRFAVYPTALSTSDCISLTTNLSTATLNWKSWIEGNGGTLPLSVLDIFDMYFFRPATANGNILNQLDRFNVYTGLANYQTAARTNLIKNAHYVTPVNSLAFDINGYKSIGTGYLNLNYTPSTQGIAFTQNSNIAGVVFNNIAINQDFYAMGSINTGGNTAHIIQFQLADSSLRSFNNSDANTYPPPMPFTPLPSGLLFAATRRTSSTVAEVLANYETAQFSLSSNGSINVSQYELAFNNSNTTPLVFDTDNYHLCSFHGSSSLDYNAFQSIVTNLLNALPQENYRP